LPNNSQALTTQKQVYNVKGSSNNFFI